MIIREVLVYMLMQMDPKEYGPNVIYEKGKNLLYIEVLKSIYGILKQDLLSYNNLGKDLETYGFKFNPYDSCVFNNYIEGEKIRIVLHVDDVKESNEDTKAVYSFKQWTEFMYGDKKIGNI